MKYVNSLLKRNCAEELITLFGHTANPVKEITESYGALHHVKDALNKDSMRMDDFMFLHVGDGSTARTGATFTFMSKSANVSIDPATNMEFMVDWFGRWDVEGFDAYKCMWEDYIKLKEGIHPSDFEMDRKTCGKKHLGIVLVHSHVSTIDLFRAFPKVSYIYVNPCCMPDKQILTVQQMKENNISVVTAGKDVQILSAQNMVYVYRNDRMFGEKI